MKLSEAIRQGSKLRPQCTGYLARALLDGMVGSCALGAAFEVVYGRLPTEYKRWSISDADSDYELLQDEFPILTQEVEDSIETPGGHLATCIQSAIAYMNDDEGMSREAIADFLEARGL